MPSKTSKKKKSISKSNSLPLKTQQENVIYPPSPSTTTIINPKRTSDNKSIVGLKYETSAVSTVSMITSSDSLPLTDPLHELQRLGGVSSVLKLLDSRVKPNISVSYGLVLFAVLGCIKAPIMGYIYSIILSKNSLT